MWSFFWFSVWVQVFSFNKGLLSDLLTVVFDNIGRACRSPRTTQAVTCDIVKVLDRVWDVDHFNKLWSDWISGQIFRVVSSFLSNEWLWVVLDINLCKTTVLMVVFLKAAPLTLLSSYYTPVIFLSVSFLIFISVLVILLSTQIVQITGNGLEDFQMVFLF